MEKVQTYFLCANFLHMPPSEVDKVGRKTLELMLEFLAQWRRKEKENQQIN